MKIKKYLFLTLHIPFILLIRLFVTSPFFVHNNLLNSSFYFVFGTIEKISNSGPLATILLLFVIPIVSLGSCLFLAIKEKQINNKSVIYIMMTLISAAVTPIFFVIMQIGLGNYL